MPKSNVIPSGIEQMPDDIDSRIVEGIELVAQLLKNRVLTAILRLNEAEADCLRRLQEFTPTNRPLNLEQAATFLGMTKRALNDGTRPGKDPVVPFLIMNGKKLFRLSSLEKELERREIKRAEVRL